MPFKRRYLPTKPEFNNKFNEINDALEYLQGQITDLQKGSTIKRTYAVDKGLVKWYIVNEYGNGLVECNGYMANPFWNAISEDYPTQAIAIVRLPVTFVNTEYVITYLGRTSNKYFTLGPALHDYGVVYETNDYKVTTSSFPVCVCPHYTGWYYRVLGWKDNTTEL